MCQDCKADRGPETRDSGIILVSTAGCNRLRPHCTVGARQPRPLEFADAGTMGMPSNRVVGYEWYQMYSLHPLCDPTTYS